MKKHVSLKISGSVQGVAYRVSAKHEADRLGVTGSVMNCHDGSVCIEAEGGQVELDKFIQWCHIGPPGARVDLITSVPGELKEYIVFEIRRSREQLVFL